MAENSPDLSVELAKSGVKLRDLADKPELQSGLLAEIVGKLADIKAEGVATIEGASTRDELLASIPKLIENVKASPSHIDKQIAGIVGKLADKDKYPDKEASAKALLEKGIVASERGYLGYVARQKYETVAASLGWSKDEDQGTAKTFIDNYLGDKPTNSDEVRQSLTTLDPNSPLESSLSGTHSAQSFENMMKNRWEAKSEESQKLEKTTNGKDVVATILGEQEFTLTDLEEGRVNGPKFNSEQYQPWLVKMQESYVSNLAPHEKAVTDRPDYQTATPDILAQSMIEMDGEDYLSARFATDFVFGNGFGRTTGSGDWDSSEQNIGLNTSLRCPDGKTHNLPSELSAEVKKKALVRVFAVHRQLSESEVIKSLTETDIQQLNAWMGDKELSSETPPANIAKALQELAGAQNTIRTEFDNAVLTLAPNEQQGKWRKAIEESYQNANSTEYKNLKLFRDKILAKFGQRGSTLLAPMTFDFNANSSNTIGNQIWLELRQRANSQT